MQIKLTVSEEKNLKRLDKLTNDPAFVVSILKNMGYKECPDAVTLKIGIIKLEDKNKQEVEN